MLDVVADSELENRARPVSTSTAGSTIPGRRGGCRRIFPQDDAFAQRASAPAPYASLLCHQEADSPLAPANKVRVAQVIADPDRAGLTSVDNDPRLDPFEALYVKLRKIAQSHANGVGADRAA